MKIPHEKFFLCLVIGQIGFMYLKNASLVHTTGTNLLLFNNFAPLLGLLVAAVFWRREIPYLKKPKTMLWIFLLAVIAGLGSSLLVYDNSVTGVASVLGDLLAFIAALFDVVLVVAQIQYIKNFGSTDPAVLNMHIFFYLLLFVSPIILAAALFHWPIFANLTGKAVLLGIGIGLFEGIGQMCNYAAFKRIDGYLAHMMFNLSVFITFVIEAFVIHSVKPTFLLLVSGLIIIGASVTAELINSQCQKKGL
jgi:drug/metabolite transporter (DMT)-like permease